MTSILKRIYKSTLGIYERKDLSSWSHTPDCSTLIYGIYHIFCDANWKEMVREQMQHLADSGLLEASNRLYISCIARNNEDIMELVDILRQYAADKIEFVQTKGITYQTTLNQEDREFRGFVDKIVAWRRMMEYFLMNQWKVAVNTLKAGYDTYGCYLFPPFKNKMYAGNFWWAKASYFRTLPALDEDTKLHNRFMAEEWLLSLPGVKAFSAFDTVADLYFVRIPPTIYEVGRHSLFDSLRFCAIYTYRKYQRKWFGYSYKQHCQQKFQQLKQSL